MSSYGVKVALRPILCDDVSGVIQDMVNREILKEIHAEYFQKLAELIENKMYKLSESVPTYSLSYRLMNPGTCAHTYAMKIFSYNQEQLNWSRMLDDIFYNSDKVVNSRYRSRTHQIV